MAYWDNRNSSSGCKANRELSDGKCPVCGGLNGAHKGWCNQLIKRNRSSGLKKPINFEAKKDGQSALTGEV